MEVRDWALTQLQHSCGVAQAGAKCKSLSLKAAPKGRRGRQGLAKAASSFLPDKQLGSAKSLTLNSVN